MNKIRSCGAPVPSMGQSVCTRDQGHDGEHRCKAADVDARRATGSAEGEGQRAARAPGVLADATPTPWYVGSQNDALYIIDRPPRPSTDDINPDADIEPIAHVYFETRGQHSGAANAALIVAAVNTRAEREAELARVMELADAYDRELTLAREYADGLEQELRVARETASALLAALEVARGALVNARTIIHYPPATADEARCLDAAISAARLAIEQAGSGEPRRDDDPAGRQCNFRVSSTSGPAWRCALAAEHEGPHDYREPADIHEVAESHAPAGGGEVKL